jgi:organic radical activating enzyme
MKFPWNKYIELPLERRNTLQMFITNKCNLKCKGCFARNVMGEDEQHISLEEYETVIRDFLLKKGKQINLLGGEPLLHPELREIIAINKKYELKTTIYTNGTAFKDYYSHEFDGVKLRVSIYSYRGEDMTKLPKDDKSCISIPTRNFDFKFDGNFMVSSKTTLNDLIKSAERCELVYGCKVFFISSLRELDNARQEFFDDTDLTMPVIQYKELVHSFLEAYQGDMDIHVSKRGVFESTTTVCDNKCRFANYFIGGRIIQCPYDVVNQKYQDSYNFNNRYCQHNSTCLMSKVIYRKK